MKEECKVSNTNTLVFYVLDYGAVHVTECSAESGAK